MNLSNITGYLESITPSGGIWDNFACSCNNEWAMAAVVLAFCLLFWVIGYLTASNVRKTE